MDQQEQIARIERAQEETRRFVAEQSARAPKALNVWPFAVGGMVAALLCSELA